MGVVFQKFGDDYDLANDFGYKTKSLNVELLATILRQQDLEEQLSEIADELWEIS